MHPSVHGELVTRAKRIARPEVVDILKPCRSSEFTQAGLQASTGQGENEEKAQHRELVGWMRNEVDRSPAYIL
jgi:hypothetical protein